MAAEGSNRLLSALSSESRQYLVDHSVAVDLPVRTVLYEAEITPHYAYFMTSGMASIVSSMEDGETAEVGVIGKEGFVGGIHLLGPAKVSTNSFIQLAGSGLQIPLSDLKTAFRSSEDIRDRILEFTQEQSLTVSQIAACNRLHETEERLARWLLMCQDRAQTEVLNFTQEFLAMMLGSRRTTVTLTAGILQQAGLIKYTRGKVRIVDREGLEDAACDCYKIAKGLINNLYAAPLHDVSSNHELTVQTG
jgi:CRP-like cAMP-binding protein